MASSPSKVTLLLPKFEVAQRDAFDPVLPCYEQRCLRYLSYPVPASDTLPTAICHSIHDFGSVPSEGSVAAVPIHIAMDSEHGRLVPVEALDISPQECHELQASINEFLKSDGTHFECVSPERWYLKGCDPDHIAQLHTLPAHVLARRNLGHFLPRGVETAYWRRLLTEIQMTLHNHPVNIARQQRGLLVVSSFWFWGGAALPEKNPDASKVTQVFADDAFTIGLASAAAVESHRLSEFSIDELPAEGHSLIVDVSSYVARLIGLEEKVEEADRTIDARWLAPLRSALADRSIDMLQIDDGQIESQEIRKKSLWQKWFAKSD